VLFIDPWKQVYPCGNGKREKIMKLLKTLAASLLLSAMAAAPAFADAGDNEVHYISPSIIMIGTADPCDDGGCEEDVAVIEAKDDNNAALIDAHGMPTSMPVIIRPSVATPSVETPAAAAATPAAPAAQPAKPAPTPVVQVEPTPAPAPMEQAANEGTPKAEGVE
jgi:hypothetical protein